MAVGFDGYPPEKLTDNHRQSATALWQRPMSNYWINLCIRGLSRNGSVDSQGPTAKVGIDGSQIYLGSEQDLFFLWLANE